MHRPRSISLQAKKDAFSLVEVVLALGIVGFAMLALLGLLPVGLHAGRDAMNLTVGTQIAQSLSSDVHLTDFSNISAATSYYDDQGIRVSASDLKVTFIATVTPEPLHSPVDLSVNAARNVRIEISQKHSPSTSVSYSVIAVNNNR